MIQTKKKLISKIHKRIGQTYKKRLVHDSVVLIFQFLAEELIRNHVFSVKNFGTLSPYMTKAHKGLNVSSGKIQVTASARSVRFRASETLMSLLTVRRPSLRKKKT